jgi:glutamate-1-semialdehyde 2,1-aminomutase
VLIFDEVMTGFRVGLNCAQGRFGITPDLTCLGKVIGGGLPVGAYGGKKEIMEQIAPSGPIYQAGTLSGNPLAMTAGFTTLSLLTPEVYDRLENLSAKLEAGFTANVKERGLPCTINRVGSMMCPFLTDQTVVNFETAKTSDLGLFRRYFAALSEEGINVAPSQFEGMFISGVHTDEDIELTIEAHRNALRRL